MPTHTKEEQFESDIVAWLVMHGGYTQGDRMNYDPALALDTAELLAFIGATQGEEWAKLVKRHGGDPDRAQVKFKARLVAELAKRGTPDVLRNGVKDQQVLIRLAYFKPASGLNPQLTELYSKNRLTVARQLQYSGEHSGELDLTLFANGLPVGTAELKNTLTGQGVDEAIVQYEKDRDPRDTLLGERAIVHFAVDPHLAYMTTHLAKGATEFLPFNRGSAPGSLSCGKGNRPNPTGYTTSYLWERVWQYDAWLDILGRFATQVERTDEAGRITRRVIFPRYHQWDAVRLLAGDVLENGTGRSYLCQHSAGSGKSNSISWLAHRLSLLHDASDDKIFDKVIVITDRRVLDEQLRENVKQFESVPGTIVTVEGKSGAKSNELAEALLGKAQIVVTTLQVFPFVLDKIAETDLSTSNYAVIVDEAHSSQTGDAATALKQAVGAGSGEAERDEDSEELDQEDAIAKLMAARGQQTNLSFFAFTATPKNRTVELFGTLNPATGRKEPFHLYTMRQAIEEGFILDVLRNYTTYSTYYRLSSSAEVADDEVDVRKASAAIRRFVTQHPTLVAQKAAIIVEHFRTHTAKALGGQAKAMVVTDSRPGAVRYKRAIDDYIKDNQYQNVKALVAFSGEVIDDLGSKVTETSMNGFPESQTAKRFKGERPFKPGDYQVLVVAEKFQTGFDEAMLHTMFVDKTLTGLNAVQTLSRLNRIARGKDEAFVLDFRNSTEDIQKAFQRYYEAVVTEPTDPNILSDLSDRVLNIGIIDPEEVTKVCESYFATEPAKRNLGLIYAGLAPAAERFVGLDDDEQADLRDALDQFIRVYAFMSQVLPFVDADLERLYVYGKALAACLPSRADGSLDLGPDLVLTHLRIDDGGSESIELDKEKTTVGKVFVGDGAGKANNPTLDTLASVIDTINERFGADLDERDKLELDKIKMSLLDRADLRQYANANPVEKYALEFGPIFKGEILDQEEHNRRLYELILSKPELADVIERELMKETYRELRGGGDGEVKEGGDTSS